MADAHDLGALLDLLQEMGEAPADYEVLTELNFFAVQLRYDDQLVMEDPDWPLCFALLERRLLQIEGRCSGSGVHSARDDQGTWQARP